MRTLMVILGMVLFGALAPSAQAAAHTKAKLVLAAESARPGDTVMAGLHLQMDPGWHNYWKNAGSSGYATSIKWELSPGVTAGEIQWPVPEEIDIDQQVTYGYHDEVVLLVPLKIGPDAKPGPLNLKGKASWLECETTCVPGNQTVEAILNVGDETKPSADASLIETWKKRLPITKPDLAAKASWESPAVTNTRPIIFEWHSTAPASTNANFFPYESSKYEFLPNTDLVSKEAGTVAIRKTLKKTSGEWPEKMAGLLVEQTGENPVAYEVDLPIATLSNAQTAAVPQSTAAVPENPTGGSSSLGLMLLYAFLGGLILNVMPCVLPVIALKILGFVNQAHDHPRQVRKLGFIYAAGVLVSFLILAGLVIAVKAAGQRAGWGMQFSNPQFIIVLTVLVTLVALNLFGLFEINPGSKVMGAAGSLASREGASGAFFNGVLATILATPCTAPFLSVALGYAFAQSTGIIILFFLTIGAGLAFPYVILSAFPAWLSILPKPGLWMEKFKIAMGFPMLATAIWLFSLTITHYGRRVWWLGIFLVFVAMAAWIYGDFVQRGRKRKGLALGVVAALLLFGYFFAVETQLKWRSPIKEVASGNSLKESPDGIDWQRWSREAVTQARLAGHPVLVDFTADWCATCQSNKERSIEVPSVREKLKQINAIAMLADNTKFPPEIAEELSRYNRAGVPLVLVFPANTNLPPEILPENLWVVGPGPVLKALEKVAGQNTLSANTR